MKEGIHSSDFDKMMMELKEALDEKTNHIVVTIIYKYTTRYL